MRELEIETLRKLSLIFTPSNFDRVLKNNNTAYITNNIIRNFQVSCASTYGRIFKAIYSQLGKSYKNEYFFKNSILNHILSKEDFLTTTVLNEFQIGRSIADCVVLNGHARIYEIKTDLDDLTKLEKQLNDYCQFANEVYIVASAKYTERLCEKYENTSIGVVELNEASELKTLKSAGENTSSFTHAILFKTLRQAEYLEIIIEYFGCAPKVPNTLLFKTCLSQCEEIEITQFQKIVFNKLKRRKLRCPDLLTSRKTPVELKHICHALNLTTSDYSLLHNFLTKPIKCDVLPIPKRKTI